MNFLAVMAGGALGALCRYLTNEGFRLYVQQGTNALPYPFATLSVNILGSFLLSLLLFSSHLNLNPQLKLAIGTGFLGALTTFSTFEVESFKLLEGGNPLAALLYMAGSVVLGFAAVLLGRWIALQGA